MKVYVAKWYGPSWDGAGTDDYNIGVFSSVELAQEAIDRFKREDNNEGECSIFIFVLDKPDALACLTYNIA